MGRRVSHPRGMNDVRTLGGLGKKKLAPHAAYMKITSLELEKLRLTRVRQHALRRVAEIDQRFGEIRDEKAALLAAMDAAAADGAGLPHRPHAGESRRSRGMSIRY